MPHMPNYKCTPPKGGGGRVLYIFLLILLAVIAVKVEAEIARYLTYILIGLAIVLSVVVVRLGFSVYHALQARTWKMQNASVMSKHDALRGYETGTSWMLNQNRKHDAGYAIPGEVIDDAQSAIEESYGTGASGLSEGQNGARSGSQRSGSPRRSKRTWPKKR